MGKVFVVISGKGGVGKTTSTINLGFSINELGKEVIIVDANLTTPNIGLQLGSPIVPVTLNHVINNKARVEDAIYEHESGAKILPSSLAIGELKNIDHERLPDVTKKLRKLADNILLDSSAGLGQEAQSAIESADEVIIITNPEITAVTDALKTIKLAEQMKKNVIGVVITRHEGEKWEMPLETIKDMLEIPILGVVPEDNSVKESHRMKGAVIHTHPKSKASKAYRKIAKRIIAPELSKEEKRKIKETEENKEGFFGRLARRLGLK